MKELNKKEKDIDKLIKYFQKNIPKLNIIINRTQSEMITKSKREILSTYTIKKI